MIKIRLDKESENAQIGKWDIFSSDRRAMIDIASSSKSPPNDVYRNLSRGSCSGISYSQLEREHEPQHMILEGIKESENHIHNIYNGNQELSIL